MGNRSASASKSTTSKSGGARINHLSTNDDTIVITSPSSPSSNAASASASVWRDTLPTALVTSIMQWLSVYETLRLLRVCGAWRAVIHDDSHWRRLLHTQFGEHATIPPVSLPWSLPRSWTVATPSSPGSPGGTKTSTAAAITKSPSLVRTSEWYHRYRRRWRCEVSWRIAGLGRERIPPIPKDNTAASSPSSSSSPSHSYYTKHKESRASLGAATVNDDLKYAFGHHTVDEWSAARYIHGTRVHGIDRQHATSIAMDHRIIVTGGYKGTVCIWNMNHGYKLATTWHGVPENKQRTISTMWMNTSRDSNLLVGSGNRSIVLWDMTRGGDGGPTRIINGHKSSLRNLQGSDNGVIVSCSHDKTVRVWDLRLPPAAECVAICNGHTSVVGGVQFDDTKIISGDFDGALLWWDWRRLKPATHAGADDTKGSSTDGTGTFTSSIRLRKFQGFIDSLQWHDTTLIVGYFKQAAIIDLRPSSTSSLHDAFVSTSTVPSNANMDVLATAATSMDAADQSLSLVAPPSSDLILACDETIGAVRLLPGQLGTEHKAVIATDSSLQLYNTPSAAAISASAAAASMSAYVGGARATPLPLSASSLSSSSNGRSSMVTGLSPLAMTVNEQRLATTTAAGNLIVLDFDHASFNNNNEL